MQTASTKVPTTVTSPDFSIRGYILFGCPPVAHCMPFTDASNGGVSVHVESPVLVKMHSCLLIVVPFYRSIQWGSACQCIYNSTTAYSILRRVSTVIVPLF